MSNYSNKTQVAYAATVWVFGGDRSLSGEEKSEILEAFNGPRTPWSLNPDDENARWVHSLYRSGQIHNIEDIIDAVENEFNFSKQEKFQLYWCVCISMNALDQGSNSEDGWSRANELRRALGIDTKEYNNWAMQE